MNNHEQALEPCPFCGGEPVLQEHEAHTHSDFLKQAGIPDHPGSWTIECCDVGMIKNTREEVIAAWNRRASLQPTEQPPVKDSLTTEQPEAAQDERLSFAVIEHLGPAALAGGKISVLDAFTLGWQAAKRDARKDAALQALVEQSQAMGAYGDAAQAPQERAEVTGKDVSQ